MPSRCVASDCRSFAAWPRIQFLPTPQSLHREGTFVVLRTPGCFLICSPVVVGFVVAQLFIVPQGIDGLQSGSPAGGDVTCDKSGQNQDDRRAYRYREVQRRIDEDVERVLPTGSGCTLSKQFCQCPFCSSGFLMQYSLFKMASSAPGIFLNLIKQPNLEL